MPVVAHPKLPSLDRPELKEMLQVDHSSNSNNSYQELHVALLNLMPDAALQATERQFISLLGSSNEFLVHVYPTSIDIGSRGQEYQKYIQDYYNDIQSIYGMPIDGLIISGANPSKPNISEESFWSPLIEVMNWADQEVNSILCSCLATHALMKAKFNIDRKIRDSKSWGVFSHNLLNTNHALTQDLTNDFEGPHSHYYDIPREEIEKTELQILAENDEAGFFLASTENSDLVLFQGHPEYDKKSLLKEYQREIENFVNGLRSDYPPLPTEYFSKESLQLLDDIKKRTIETMEKPVIPENELLSTIEANWQESGRVLYRNWLNILFDKKERS
ncbi:MAG: homoserine O-succinyltransferase [Gammaproteobacteria bacterium]|jgi:homoserine O-succinyltransferase|nr:homoserine O-succinyltransferase [Gammaproteobacteria bacterium]